MNTKLREILETPIGEKVWVAAHRGRFGGNIPENTIAAFQNAIHAGADIVETDVTRLSDAELVLFHDTTVDRLTRGKGECKDYSRKEFLELELLNAIGGNSGMHPNTLDEFLRFMKGKCILNLDKCRDYMDEVYEKILFYDMEDQVMLKNHVPCTKDLLWLKETGYKPLYVPVVSKDEEIPLLYDILEEMEIKVVEIFYHSVDALTISADFIKDMHSRGIKIFANALTLSGSSDLCAGIGDNVSLLQGADRGWGWMVEHGIDIIQTDWTRECCDYLRTIGKR